MGLTCKAAPAAMPLSEERKVVRELTLKVDGKRGNGHRKKDTALKTKKDFKYVSGKHHLNKS